MSVSQTLPLGRSGYYLKLFTLYSIVFLGSAGFFVTIPAYVELFMGHSQALIHTQMPLEQRRELFGIVMSLAPFISMFFAPLMARFSDRFGRKPLMAICLVIAAIGFALPVFAIAAGSIILLFIGNMLNSLGSASQPMAQAVLAEGSDGKHKATLMSLVAVVMTAAMSIGPAIGSKLTEIYGATAPFYACLLLALVNLSLLWSISSAPVASSQSESIWSLTRPLARSKSALLPSLGLVFICQFCWSLYFQSIAFILPEKWHLAVSGSFYQGLMTAIGIIMILSLLLLPQYLMTRWSLISCLRAALWVCGVGMLLLAVSPTPWLHALAMLPTAISAAILFPLYITRLSDSASQQDQGWAMALASAAIGLAWTLSGYLTAILANIYLLLPLLLAALGLFAANLLTRESR
ncbi:MFS transporter [Dongshaea marina]|uniref:MFS transporter n=1 Tax=Dongshaea marina TaxID=2047966 RepID=UPI000D3E8A49|nr:MFS transporter [Dongshaea marina]